VLNRLRRVAGEAAGRVEALVNEERIGLAVTGLSRAGKTVFITSLVNNLLALGADGQGRDTLPKFTRALGGRLRGVRILPEAGGPPRFDYAGKLASLAAAAPNWPEPTERLAQISLAITLERRGTAARLAGTRRVRLDILDYPGEWLLDLPLLAHDFSRWSAETLALLRMPPRAELAGRFLAWLAHLRADDPADATALAHGAALYRESLRAAAARGLRFLQPGRLVAPPRADDPESHALFPLEGDGPTARVLAARFAAYQRDIRRCFFDTHFRSFDRQVMLVDVLSALKAGRAAFEDTAHATASIVAGLRHGWGGFGGLHDKVDDLPFAHRLPPLLLGGRVVPRPIGRIAFVATKADHVPELQRGHLRNLLRAMAEPGGGGPAISHHVAASVLATEDAVARMDGRPVGVVRGVMLGDTEVSDFHVGEVPSAIPPAGFWGDAWFTLPVFRPPRIAIDGSGGIRNLGLDDILTTLIGDRL
jgi:predicted YcjX-like family ATPase